MVCGASSCFIGMEGGSERSTGYGRLGVGFHPRPEHDDGKGNASRLSDDVRRPWCHQGTPLFEPNVSDTDTCRRLLIVPSPSKAEIEWEIE